MLDQRREGVSERAFQGACAGVESFALNDLAETVLDHVLVGIFYGLVKGRLQICYFLGVAPDFLAVFAILSRPGLLYLLQRGFFFGEISGRFR